MKITIPTWLTLVRIALVPWLAYAISTNAVFLSLFLLSVALFTDFLDGFLARRYYWTSSLGALLDPLADKLLMITLFICCALVAPYNQQVPSWLSYMLLFKEIVLVVSIGVLRLRGYSLAIAPHAVGKVALAIQGFFLILVIGSHWLGLAITGLWALLFGFLRFCVAGLTLAAACVYAYRAFDSIYTK